MATSAHQLWSTRELSLNRDQAAKQVLHVINSPDPGGVLALAETLADGLREHGFASDMLFLAERPNESVLTKLKGAFKTAWRLMEQREARVVAYQTWPSIVVALARLFGGPKQLIIHQTTVPHATKPALRWASALLGTLGLYPTNVVNTAFTRTEFDRYPARYRWHLKLIEHGVERPVVRRSREETLRRYGIPVHDRTLLNTGRLAEQKHQEVIIRALPQLPDHRFLIAGEGELRASLTRLAQEVGVADRVHFLGALPHEEAAELYGAADVFVFPSLHETFGISAVEAVMLGVPTVAADIPVLREVLTIGGDSPVTFLDPLDVHAWAGALRTISERQPDRARLTDFGRRLGERYAAERMTKAYVSLLN